MGQIAHIGPGSGDYSAAQLRIIRHQNATLNADEFDVLVEMARATGLNLFRRQLSAIVFAAHNPKKRRVAYVIGIDGYRAMADRTGTYLPSESPAVFEIDESLKGPLNPAGIVSCTVRVKKFAHGAWHEFSATAYWDEFAPIEDEWGEGEDGRRRPTGNKALTANWRKMQRVMLAKVAEAQALRKGWPDTMAGLYTEDEMERERVLDLTASEVVAGHEEDIRIKKIGGANAIVIDWCDGGQLDRVPVGALADRALAWLADVARDANEIKVWQHRNEHSLREFWARAKSDALGLKKQIDERLKELEAAP